MGVTLASAQTPAQSGPQNPAMQTQPGNNSDMPVKGANSFTSSQAKSRLAAKGFTHIGTLRKDNNGVWRGTALKDGVRVPVSVDYQGNVNAS
jgi:negative regulator of sigma E activity